MKELKLKYVRPTEKEWGHTKVYFGEEYLGYFLKGRIIKNWCFEPRPTSRMPYLKAATRKLLLIEIAKSIGN